MGHVDAFLNAIEELSYRATTVKTIPENTWGEMGFRRISVKITGQKSLVSSKYIGKSFSIKPSIFSKALEYFSILAILESREPTTHKAETHCGSWLGLFLWRNI